MLQKTGSYKINATLPAFDAQLQECRTQKFLNINIKYIDKY